MQRIADNIEQRKKRFGTRKGLDLNKAKELVTTFSKLRTLFPANYLCLFDSIALIEFLARHDIYPTWLFAVRFRPWAAHCWVQHDGIVFNEELSETEEYTPIMAI